MVKHAVAFSAIMAGVVLLLVAGPGVAPEPAPEPASRIVATGDDSFPLVLADPSGRHTVLAARPRRIVSVTLGSDEILLDLVDPARIAALTRYVDDPRCSSAVARARAVTGRVTGDVEEILAAGPDLVLVASYTRAEQVALLAGAGPAVYRFTSFGSFADLESNVLALARLTGDLDAGRRIVALMRARLGAVARRLPPPARRPRLLYVSEGLWTVGPGTTVHEILVRAGGRNLAAEKGRTGWSSISTEEIVAWDPEIVIGQTTAGRPRRDARWLARLPGIASVRALTCDPPRVWLLPARTMTAVSHHAVTAVEQLHRILYP